MAYTGLSRLDMVVGKVFGSNTPVLSTCRLGLRLLLHLEIPQRHFANGLTLIHPYNVIVHPDAQLGRNVTLYHNVTIATVETGSRQGTPVIGDDVTIYPNSIILGSVHIGDGAVIGASSVVTHDVPDGEVVAGNPARPVRPRDSTKPSVTKDEAS